jgi:hypothetical protein
VAQILTLGLAAVAIWALWSASRPRPAFVIRIAGGTPQVARGRVPREFLQDVAQTCGRHGVSDAVVRGLVQNERIALAFSGRIPQACRQQLRNLWGLSGWSAPSRLNR